ncbi:MAG TPA: cyclic nucleotide-binding domain-containing protein [Candidatus Limnocylindrales bacterium]|nr:cyclic nucleotide-binding domain-containing protein [Candidatus Limnocylindrales bacterium]
MRKVLFLFGELNDADVDWLIGNGSSERVSKGSVLVDEGRPIRALYIVLDGSFEVLLSHAALGRMGAGEILGEISFVDSRPPTTTVRALTDATVFALPRDLLALKLKGDPGFASRFYRALAMFLSHRLRVLTLKFAEPKNVTGPEPETALDQEVLSSVYLAGKRFERLLKQLTPG